MTTVSACWELITCNGGKQHFQLFWFIDHLSAFTFSETFSSRQIETFILGHPQLWISDNRCKTQAAIFFSIQFFFFSLSLFLGLHRRSISHERFMLAEGFLLHHVRRISLDVLFLPASSWKKMSYHLSLLDIFNALPTLRFVNKTFIIIGRVFASNKEYYWFDCWGAQHCCQSMLVTHILQLQCRLYQKYGTKMI